MLDSDDITMDDVNPDPPPEIHQNDAVNTLVGIALALLNAFTDVASVTGIRSTSPGSAIIHRSLSESVVRPGLCPLRGPVGRMTKPALR